MQQFRLDCISEQGRRERNEDSFWCASYTIDGRPCAVACVCDGMGGLDDGKQTSQMIANTVEEYCKQYGTIAGLPDAVLAQSRLIYNTYTERGVRSGTTCTILFLTERKWYMYHIGDSRLYKYDVQQNRPMQLSYDHTALNACKEQLEALERADPATDPDAEAKHRRAHRIKQEYRNKLTRCLGVMESPDFDTTSGTYRTGDRFLLCSDGFWHYLSAPDFNADTITDLRGLVEKFLRAGEADNLTAVLVTIEDGM